MSLPPEANSKCPYFFRHVPNISKHLISKCSFSCGYWRPWKVWKSSGKLLYRNTLHLQPRSELGVPSYDEQTTLLTTCLVYCVMILQCLAMYFAMLLTWFCYFFVMTCYHCAMFLLCFAMFFVMGSYVLLCSAIFCYDVVRFCYVFATFLRF